MGGRLEQQHGGKADEVLLNNDLGNISREKKFWLHRGGGWWDGGSIGTGKLTFGRHRTNPRKPSIGHRSLNEQRGQLRVKRNSAGEGVQGLAGGMEPKFKEEGI